MNTLSLESIESAINQLSFLEQVRLLERLAQRIRRQTERRQSIEDQLAAMAADPDIQRELRQIEAEFSVTEMDGLPDESFELKG
ncbi:MAG TPA: hypothetical protein VFY40_19470 [Blastocatellia bacterium]|nr:hypothetical protein [Blastocatellia bacterium]